MKHQHECRNCHEKYECGNADCLPGTVHFQIRKEICIKCQSIRSLLRTSLDYPSGRTIIYCPVCLLSVQLGTNQPPCAGIHPCTCGKCQWPVVTCNPGNKPHMAPDWHTVSRAAA